MLTEHNWRMRSVVDEVIRRIVATAQPQRILLFGSSVRGHANEDSDLDFLVIMRGPVHRRASRRKFTEICMGS